LPLWHPAQPSVILLAAAQGYCALAFMKMILASVFTTLLTIVMTLAAIFTLVRTTLYVTSLVSPVQRASAIGAELFLGVVLLLGTVWLATHLAARIFGKKASSMPGGPLA
jgi:hypothetical protein